MTSNQSLFQRGIEKLSAATTNFQFAAPLLTRLVIGTAFFYTGRGKLQNLDRTISFFTDLGIPFPGANAVFISSLEMIGGACLMLGFGTRIFAALLSSTMIVALLTADKEGFVAKFPAELTDVTPVVFLMFLVWLVLYGAGAVSVDGILGRIFRPRNRLVLSELPKLNLQRVLRLSDIGEFSSKRGIKRGPAGIQLAYDAIKSGWNLESQRSFIRPGRRFGGRPELVARRSL